MGQVFIAELNILNCSLIWKWVLSCVLCVQVAKRLGTWQEQNSVFLFNDVNAFCVH